MRNNILHKQFLNKINSYIINKYSLPSKLLTYKIVVFLLSVLTILTIFFVTEPGCKDNGVSPNQYNLTSWKEANGTQGLRISGLDVYERNPDSAYAISTTGILLSTDGGYSWNKVSQFISDIGPLRIDPTNSKILYTRAVWEVDPDFTFTDVSKDGGKTWQELFTSLSRYEGGSIVEFDPDNSKTIYIGNGPATLRRSTDGGLTWDSLALPENDLSCLAISSANDNILYLGSIHGILKSTDKGVTWKQIGLPFQVNNVSSIAVDPSNSDVVYAGIFSLGSTPGGVYKSTDGGINWSAKNNGLDSTDWSVDLIRIDPTNSNQLFLGIGTPSVPHDLLFRSTDAGNRWSSYNVGLPYRGHVSSIGFNISKNLIYVAIISALADTSGVYLNNIPIDLRQPSSFIPFILNQKYPNSVNKERPPP